MKALVVYESMFGNTKRVAQAVADGLRGSMEVDLLEVGGADGAAVEEADLLVVGGPTHAHGLSGKGTRQAAAKDASEGLVSNGEGLREWIASLPATAGKSCASFDTRFAKPRWLTGSAARGAEKRLRRSCGAGRELLRGRLARTAA